MSTPWRLVALVATLLATAVAVIATAPTGAAARVCLFKDGCARSGILSGRPGDVVVDACGKEILFSPTCVARRILMCTIKDPCAWKKKTKPVAVVPMSFRGGVVKDLCGRSYRVTRMCKLVRVSPACYTACMVRPIKVGTRLIPGTGRPLTCASKCK
ncbi:hypothetical protein I4F81_007025 [Pyropia yezoensis]|uniref:Uncharacterized protein n=1 Tax=Pyropia yezoensis TaxID=2788 RepID=A0ACC3C2Y2_PYRYE|nr:hypothetical protein I4F81_007025 [Neopyropia yezoensis]|eukprot:contig_13293_g3171